MIPLRYVLTKTLTECLRITFFCVPTSWSYLYPRSRPWENLEFHSGLSKSSIF